MWGQAFSLPPGFRPACWVSIDVDSCAKPAMITNCQAAALRPNVNFFRYSTRRAEARRQAESLTPQGTSMFFVGTSPP
jgi:hypothetical protein